MSKEEKVKSEQIEVIGELVSSFKKAIEFINEEKGEKANLGFKDQELLLANAIDSLKESYLVFSGEFSTGKSTFINSILGVDILPTASDPCTSIVTEISFSKNAYHQYKLHYLNNTVKDLQSLEEVTNLLDGRLGEIGYFATIHHLEWIYGTGNDENQLIKMLEEHKIKIIDTPGFNSPYGFNEGIVTEYLAKAKYCYWLFPVDKFGGTRSKEFLKSVMKNNLIGDYLFPVFTKSDLLEDEDQKDNIVEKFVEHYGKIFKNAGSVSFVSPKKLREARLKREDGDIEKSRELEQQSGIESFVSSMLRSNVNAKIDEREYGKFINTLDKIYKDISSDLDKYSSEYQSKLKNIGWDINNNENSKLLKLKTSLLKQSKEEAKNINMSFMNEIESKISILLTTNSSMNPVQTSRKIENIFTETLENNIESDIKKHINNIASKFDVEFHNISPEKVKEIALHLQGTIGDNISKTFKTAFDVVSEQGAPPALLAIIAVALLQVTTIGFVTVATGGAYILGAIALTNYASGYMNIKKRNKENDDMQMKMILNKQLKQLKIEAILFEEFKSAIEKLFQEASSNDTEEINELKMKYMKIEEMKQNIHETYKDLKEIGR